MIPVPPEGGPRSQFGVRTAPRPRLASETNNDCQVKFELIHMRYPAAEKLEIIRLVEQAPLPVRHTLAKLGIPRATFYRWYERYSRGGPEALNDRSPRPDRVWNRIPDPVRQRIIQLALDEPALLLRELAV